MSNVLDIFCHLIFAKDVSLDDASLLGLDHVAHALGEDGIAVVSAAVSGEESDEALPCTSVSDILAMS